MKNNICLKSDDSKKNGVSEIEANYDKWKSSLNISINNLKEQVKTLSIDFKTASLQSIEIDIKQDDNVREAKYILKVIDKDNQCEFRFKNCYYTGKRWTLIEGIKLYDR